MAQTRATPDELLRRMEPQERDKNRGKLKIFFGYAAGVGKTYAMLEAAHVAQKQGVDVVVGYIEPYTRPQTMKLLEGLEQLQPLLIRYKGITLREFDLDGAIRRRPQLVLVDELAHSNAEDCRHVKRYQDIEELLKTGIDVYTTVNVQHIESLNDIVASVTGMQVGERIPDHVFDDADQVELVDIEPEELIKRLNDGKVYGKTQAEQPLGNFFTVENLISLREIALRRSADRVNRLAERAKLTSAQGGHYADEHILVCLSPAPSNAKILRTAARMANAFKGRFTALFVQTPAFSHLSKENKLRLQANVKLARQLGARIETVYGDDVPFQIAEFARLTGASKVVVGRSNTRRRLLMLGRQSFIDRLTVLAPNLDIYVIPEIKRQPYRESRYHAKPVFTLQDTVKSCLVLLGATLLGWTFERLGFSEANIITVYILGVLVTAIVTSNRSYSIISALLSVIIFNFLFIDPRYSLTAYDSGYPITFLVMFLAAFLSGSLAARIKSQAKLSARTAYRTQVLLETNQLLQQEKTPEGIAEATARQLIKLLGKSVVFYGVKEGALAEPRIFSAGQEGERVEGLLAENEKAVAQWAFRNNKHAGATTNTLGSALGLYLAVRGSDGVYGVMGIDLRDGGLDAFENNLVLSMLSECALALERDLFSRKREEAAMQAKNEQLRANLLRSISHDLRTPLTSISGNAGVLLNNADTLDADKRHKLYMDIYDDAMWLINLVENLLSVTRIEDGTMHLTMEAELLEEVITEALRHINRKSTEHIIRVIPPQGFVMARMDARLIVQVIINIVDNAIKYTPVGSQIVISAATKGKTVEVCIADNGPGIPDEAKARIFDMFYTAKATKVGADSRRGLGLGLALCKAIITAHGGTISVEDDDPHGTVFRFTLQAEEVSIHE